MAHFLDQAIESIGSDPAADACPDCGYPWRPTVEAAEDMLRGAADRYADAIRSGVDPYRPRPPLTWSASAYTWHVADVASAWAERAVALQREPDRPLVGFDQDQLAAARGYALLSVEAGLWALGSSIDAMLRAVAEAGADRSFHHPDWGDGTLGDGLRWVAHEVAHHQQDVRSSVA